MGNPRKNIERPGGEPYLPPGPDLLGGAANTPLAGTGAPMTYFQKLRDPRWQKKRLEAMELAGFRCEACGSADHTLNIHHRIYIKGREPWEYELSQLACLCDLCHTDEHTLRERVALFMAYDPQGALILSSYIQGLRGERCPAQPVEFSSWLEGYIGCGDKRGKWFSSRIGDIQDIWSTPEKERTERQLRVLEAARKWLE